jgi:hypothetical protein
LPSPAANLVCMCLEGKYITHLSFLNPLIPYTIFHHIASHHRQSIFENCYELQPAFQKLLLRPTKLELLSSERYPCERKVDAKVKEVNVVEGVEHMGSVVQHFVEALRASSEE